MPDHSASDYTISKPLKFDSLDMKLNSGRSNVSKALPINLVLKNHSFLDFDDQTEGTVQQD